MNSPSRIIFAVLIVLSAVCTNVSLSQLNTHVDKFEAQKWRDDLKYMSEEMRTYHRNLFHTVTEFQFNEAIKKLDQQIPSLARHQIIIEMARIVAMIGDGHTNIAPTRDPKIGFRTYPLKLYFFSDGLYVRAATREYANVVGSRIIKVGNVSVEQAYSAVRQIIGRDNEMGERFFAPFLLTMPEVLHALGLISDMDNGTYTVEIQGHQKTITVKPFGFAEMLAPDTDTNWMLSDDWIDARQDAHLSTPLWLKDPRNKFWFEYLPDSKTLYVQLNQVGNKDSETVEAFSKRLFAFVDDNPINRFILDLRLNRGGNGQYNRPLLLGIIKSKIDKKGKLFTVIGRSTWSAAQFLVGELEKYTNTIFVGEPTGGKPNSYGDSHKITLPNSGITVRVSTLWWQGDERDTRQWIAPQITSELTFQHYRMNVDPCLDVILNYVPQKTLNELLTDALSEGGWTSAMATYNKWKADPTNTYENVEEELNVLGYQLLSSKRPEEAIEIFKLNVEAYPKSANVYDSLGEAYMVTGQKELSVENYRKSLELNPKNSNAKQMLKKLETK